MLETYPLVIPGGVVKDAAPYARRGRWIDSDKIRFRMGKPEGIGGWVRVFDDIPKGKSRYLQGFSTLAGVRNMFIGTHAKAYVWFAASDLNDVTPIVESGTRSNQISTTAGSRRVGLTLLPTTPRAIGTYIRISGASAVGGVPAAEINAEHEVVNIVGDTFLFDVATTATSSAFGGGTVSYQVDYPAGNEDSVGHVGWGVLGWGVGGWGGTGITTTQRLGWWYSDSWGEDLISNPVGGPIFYWDATTPGARMTPISSMVGASRVPLVCSRALVWEQNRIVLAFAANAIGGAEADPLLVRWSDNENYLQWDPTVAGSAAGELRLPVGSAFVAALKAPNEILAWTDVALHSLTPSGGDSVFSIRVISPRATIFGAGAAAVLGDVVYWFGPLGFFRYAGSVQMVPCPVEEYIRARMNPQRAAKMVAAANAEFSEVMWLYVSEFSPDGEPDSYVKYNAVENLWDVGTLNRTAWLDSSTFDRPVAVSPEGRVLFHEVGNDDRTDPARPEPIVRRIAHGPIEIDGKGHNFILTRWLLPDISFINPAVGSGSVEITPTFSYGSGFPRQPSPPAFVNVGSLGLPTEEYPYQVRMRGRGRELSLQFRTDQVGINWRLGDNRVVGRPDGRR